MLLCRSGRFNRWSALVSLLSIPFLLAGPVLAKEKKRPDPESPGPSASPAGQGLTNIPLATGHEAKGLVLPDFDLDGKLRGKFEAGTARRIDEEHIGFQGLKIITYTPEKATDLVIELSDSVLDLKTKVLTSKERSTIKRTDFNISGDSLEFDTNARSGKLMGNVKMVITGLVPAAGKKAE